MINMDQSRLFIEEYAELATGVRRADCYVTISKAVAMRQGIIAVRVEWYAGGIDEGTFYLGEWAECCQEVIAQHKALRARQA